LFRLNIAFRLVVHKTLFMTQKRGVKKGVDCCLLIKEYRREFTWH
jgi:hypothetical protein